MITVIVVLAAAVAYLVMGLVTAKRFHQDGHTATAAAAVFTWPLLLPDTDKTPSHRASSGPHGADIRDGLARLAEATRDSGCEGLIDDRELQGIARALNAADARVARVDRLLADPALADAPEGDRLRAARDQAAAEIRAVLKGLVQLRVQLGLVALVGDTAPVQDRLRELTARLSALDELGNC